MRFLVLCALASLANIAAAEPPVAPALVNSDLIGKTAGELRLMRNEIYARRGYRFKSPEWQAHFALIEWYTPKVDDVASAFSEAEKAKVALLLKAEQAAAERELREALPVREPRAAPSRYPVRSGKCALYGFVDVTGKPLGKPRFTDAKPMRAGRAPVMTGGRCNDRGSVVEGRWGVIDEADREIVEPKYELIGEFSAGLARFRAGGKYGMLDTTGKVVIEPQYAYLGDLHEGRINFSRGGRFGYLDATGKEVIAPVSQYASDFSEGLAVVLLDDLRTQSTQRRKLAHFIDRNGRRRTFITFVDLGPMSEGLAAAAIELEDKAVRYGFVDRTGKFVLPPTWHHAQRFSEGVAAVGAEEGWTAVAIPAIWWDYVDRKGKTVIRLPCADTTERLDGGSGETFKTCPSPTPFNGGLALAREESRTSILAKSGKTLARIPFAADTAGFDGNLARILKGDSWGYVDRAGRIAVKP